MNTEQLVQVLKQTLGDNLVSAAAYGSAVHGDPSAPNTGTNVFVLVQRADGETLRSLATALNGWRRANNPPPLVLPEREFQRSQDAFPIEYLDLKLFHRMLTGADPFTNISTDNNQLREQLEFELRSKLIQLRANYLVLAGDDAALRRFLVKSLSSFSVLFKTILYLAGKPVPAQRRDVWKALSEFISLNADIFEHIEDGDPHALFARLLAQVEKAVQFVDEFQGGLK